MSHIKTKKLIEWLEINHHNKLYSIDDIKEIISILLAELAYENDKTFESLPYSIIDGMIESMKASGQWYRLDDKIENFKSKLSVNS